MHEAENFIAADAGRDRCVGPPSPPREVRRRARDCWHRGNSPHGSATPLPIGASTWADTSRDSSATVSKPPGGGAFRSRSQEHLCWPELAAWANVCPSSSRGVHRVALLGDAATAGPAIVVIMVEAPGHPGLRGDGAARSGDLGPVNTVPAGDPRPASASRSSVTIWGGPSQAIRLSRLMVKPFSSSMSPMMSANRTRWAAARWASSCSADSQFS